MIHANELRFGNKVLNQAGRIITVEQILHSTIVFNNYLQVDKESNPYGSSVLTYTSRVVEVIEEIEYQHLTAIPLTEELLKNCGFRNFLRDEWVLSFGRSHADFTFDNDTLQMKEPAAFRRPIKYLHQLQNVFFALTGQELSIGYIEQPAYTIREPRKPLAA